MSIRCKNTNCNNTFLRSDGHTYGYCEDCYEARDELEPNLVGETIGDLMKDLLNELEKNFNYKKGD